MSILRWVVGSCSTLILAAALPAAAHPVTYGGSMSNAGEPATAANSFGTGYATVIFNDDDYTLHVHVEFSNLEGITTISHIHCCTTAPGTGSAGVATALPSFPDFPVGVHAGVYDKIFDMTQANSWNPAFITANGGTIGSAFAVFATGLAGGKAYLNIHSSTSGGGEIRTFLNPVPVPAAVWLLLSGFVALGRTAVRRRSAAA